MIPKNIYLMIVLVIVIFNIVCCDEHPLRKIETSEDLRIIVYPPQNAISNSNIRPTSAIVEHKPGVPPDWPKPPSTMSTKKPSTTSFKPFFKPNKPLNLLGAQVSRPLFRLIPGEEVTENIVQSGSLALRIPSNKPVEYYSQFIKQPHRSNVVDWFLGIVGVRPPDSHPSSTVKPVQNCPPCACGKTFKHKRIVGGVETMVNEYPWMTALLYNGNKFYCGASLINNKYLLTAAHCVSGFSAEKISAVFLDHDRSTAFETQTLKRNIKNVYRHNSYGSGGNYNNDIALLKLDEEVPLTGMLKPVCLPPTGKSFTSYDGIATGWGATKEHGQISTKLREVTVPIMSNIDCRKTGYGYRITDNMLCAGYPDGKKDSCQGDSGGPLHVLNNTFHQVVGIVSWGEGCAQANYPGVYTRVNRYISWIKSNTRDACYC